jgi:hypothetical protein
MKNLSTRLLLTLFLLIGSAQSGAAQFERRGEFDIHYTTFSSMLIPSDVAHAHDITRAENMMVVNITIKKGNQSIRGKVTGHATNLLNQLVALEFDEISESNAVYYLSEVIARENDIFSFELKVQPQLGDKLESDTPYKLNFLRRY